MPLAFPSLHSQAAQHPLVCAQSHIGETNSHPATKGHVT